MRILLGVLVAAILLAPSAYAHPHATVVEANGNRCYILTSALGGEIEYWLETNGVRTGGEAMGPPGEGFGLPVSGLPFWDALELVFNVLGVRPGDVDESLKDGHSGLQRHAFGGMPADTQLTPDEFALLCVA
jgi:hypothetical protein